MEKQIVINRNDLGKDNIDIGGRDIVIGFSEPAFRSEDDAFIVDAPLNARLISYFLPAVQIAKMQISPRRTRLYIVSGIKAAINLSVQYSILTI